MHAEADPAAAAQPLGHLERLRAAELETASSWLPFPGRVLELGGGSGFQASLMASKGCQVESLDVFVEPGVTGRYHAVQHYDGVHLPFADRSFDVVFSSNVLEHVRDLPALLREVRRVLRPEGVAVHILPTPAWRIWTSLAHYPFLLKYALGAGLPASVAGDASGATRPVRTPRNWRELLWKVLAAGPHGEYPSAWSELWYFSRRRWRALFIEQGMELRADEPTHLFYTGYCLVTGLPLPVRRGLSALLGSACRIYVMRAAGRGDAR